MSAGTPDLIAFLNARLREREHRANLAKQAIGRGRYDNTWEHVTNAMHADRDMVPNFGRAWQMLAHDADPNTILADVAAKRAIVELHGPDERWDYGAGVGKSCRTCISDREDRYSENWEPEKVPCATLRALALPFAAHPDYREEWKL